MTNVGERILKLRKEAGLARDALGSKIGVSKTSIKNWEDGENPPKLEHLQALAKFFKVDFDWLATGKGEMQTSNKSPDIAEPSNVEPFTPKKTRLLPVINWVIAGDFAACGDDVFSDYEYSSDDWGHFWLTIKGDSMTPVFDVGDMILIDTERQPRTGDYVVARVAGEADTTFKKAKLNLYDETSRKEYMQLIALNDFYPVIDSRNRPFEIVGVAVEHKRSLV